MAFLRHFRYNSGMPTKRPEKGSPLTRRQTEALREFASGAARDVVAERMGITPSAVNSLLLDAYVRLGVNSLISALIVGGFLVMPLPEIIPPSAWPIGTEGTTP